MNTYGWEFVEWVTHGHQDCAECGFDFEYRHSERGEDAETVVDEVLWVTCWDDQIQMMCRECYREQRGAGSAA